MVVCNGRGNTGGTHCCILKGETCPLLFIDRGGTPRCSVWGEWDSEPYLSSDAAAYYKTRFPGQDYNCGDWPQNIPEVMDNPALGKCCYG